VGRGRYPILIAGLLTSPVHPVSAQLVFPTGSAVLRGRIYDSLTSRAIARSRICSEFAVPVYGRAMRCGRIDSLGWYVFDSLPEGPRKFTAGCAGEKLFGGKLLGAATVELQEGATHQVDFRSDASGCDPRPLRVVRGVFKGHYSSGFEHSEFIVCPGGMGQAASDTAGMRDVGWRAWVEFPKTRRLPGAPAVWPRAGPPRSSGDDGWHYVEWHGVLEGPGHYGHLGGSSFQLVVDSVITVRTPGKSDCGSRRN
jgi:hypothetical protein